MKTGTLALLQPDLMVKAVRTFDRGSALMVIAVWVSAVTFVGLGYLSVQQTIASRQQMVEAQAMQPVLPEIRQDDVVSGQIDSYVERVSKRYGGNKVAFSNNGGELKISAATADAFSSWMGAISYLDTIAPDISWTIKDFCVGPSCKDGLMTVRLTAKRITFVAPAPAE